jgi:hypothetical protein
MINGRSGDPNTTYVNKFPVLPPAAAVIVGGPPVVVVTGFITLPALLAGMVAPACVKTSMAFDGEKVLLAVVMSASGTGDMLQRRRPALGGRERRGD